MAFTIKGADRVVKLMNRMASPQAERLIDQALLTAADMIASDAAVSITTGSSGGHAGGKHQHIPSRPGQPPNNDTGLLATNIRARKSGRLEAEVVSQAPYSAHLEFGTSKMAERPFMRPAVRKNREKARKLVAAQINQILKGQK